MTPKEKANEIIKKFDEKRIANYKYVFPDWSKDCALICVDEILNSEKLNYLFSKEEINLMEFTSDSMWIHERFTSYWEKVKLEIEKL